MKYLEELNTGDCFIIDNQYFLLTTDFKRNGDKLAISLKNGSAKWFSENTIINTIDIFTLDKENNIIAIKERTKNAVTENTNIS